MHLKDKLREYIEKEVFTPQGKERIIPEDAKWLMDFRRVCLDPVFLDAYTELFYEHFKDRYPFQVGGIEVAAIPLVSAIVMKMREKGKPVNGFFIRKSRKKTGLLKMIEGKITDDPVILVDDLINKGNTLDRQLKIMAELDKNIISYFILLRFRSAQAYEKYESSGIKINSIFSLEDFTETLGAKLMDDKDRNNKVLPESFKVDWSFQSLDPKLEHVIPKPGVVLDKEKLYFGSDKGIFWSLNQTDGTIAWKQQIGFKPKSIEAFSNPIIHDKRIYFCAHDGNTYCLDTETGGKVWVSMDTDWVHGSPIINTKKGILYVPSTCGFIKKRGCIVALNIKNGKLLWLSSATSGIPSTPLFVSDIEIVFTGDENGFFFALDSKTGKELWRFQSGGAIKDAAVYEKKKGLVYFSSFDGNVYALSAKKGTLVWKQNIGLANFSSPAIWENRLYIASLDKNLYCLESSTGEKLWEFETRGRIFCSPRIENGKLYIGANDARLYEVDPNTGKQTGFFQTVERITNPVCINVDTDKIFLQTYANQILCLSRNEENKNM